MIWVAWRQHRWEGLWTLVATAMVAAAIGLVAYELQRAGCSGPGQSLCLPNDAGGMMAAALSRLNLYQYGLVVLPALAGAFIGAPLVARELESGTHRLAWTQGVTRARWLLVKIALVTLPLLLAAAAVGGLEIVYLNVQGADVNRWAVFDQQAPVVVGATLLALTLGIAFGAVLRRSILAMAATLVAFVVFRVGIAELARPIYQTPWVVSSQDFPGPNAAGIDTSTRPTAWWIDQPHFVDAAGRDLGDRLIVKSADPSGYLYRHGISLVHHFQPGDRFWTFQSIETAILTVIAIACLSFGVWWVVRRAA